MRDVETKPSFSDYLAVERTFLAWIRTALALMGFGFVVARFGLFRELQLTQPTMPDGSASRGPFASDSGAPADAWATPWSALDTELLAGLEAHRIGGRRDCLELVGRAAGEEARTAEERHRARKVGAAPARTPARAGDGEHAALRSRGHAALPPGVMLIGTASVAELAERAPVLASFPPGARGARAGRDFV